MKKISNIFQKNTLEEIQSIVYSRFREAFYIKYKSFHRVGHDLFKHRIDFQDLDEVYRVK